MLENGCVDKRIATHRHQLNRLAHPKFDSRECVNCDNVETCVKENTNITAIKWDKNTTKQTENKEANEDDDVDKNDAKDEGDDDDDDDNDIKQPKP